MALCLYYNSPNRPNNSNNSNNPNVRYKSTLSDTVLRRMDKLPHLEALRGKINNFTENDLIETHTHVKEMLLAMEVCIYIHIYTPLFLSLSLSLVYIYIYTCRYFRGTGH